MQLERGAAHGYCGVALHEAEALDNLTIAIEEYLAAVDGELKGATSREVEVAA